MGLSDWLFGNNGGGGASMLSFPSTAGVRVTPTSANNVSAYYACINNISQDIAKMPIYIMKDDGGGGQVRLKNSVDRILNKDPNGRMTPLTCKQSLIAGAAGWGNGYARINFDRKMIPQSIEPIHPSRVIPKLSDNNELYYEVYPIVSFNGVIPMRKGDPIILRAYEMIHVKGISDDGIIGKSVLEHAIESLGGAIAVQQQGNAFFGNGANPSVILKHPKSMTAEAIARFKAGWFEKFGGSKKSNGVAILEDGMDVVPLTINPRDAQVLELRRFLVEDVSRWFRMPPHKIGDLSRSTNNNIESQNIDYLTDTLLTWIVNLEQEIWLKLVRDDSIEVKTQVKVLLRGDMAARSAYNKDMFYIGALSINEIRKDDDRNPIGPEGDDHYIPVNMAKAGDTDNEKIVGAGSAKALTSIVEFEAERIVSKESKACANEMKKDRDHSEWLSDFFIDQISYAFTCLSPIAKCDDVDLKSLHDILVIHYSGRTEPSSIQEIVEVYNASKR